LQIGGLGWGHRCFRHHHPRFGRNHHDRRGERPSCHPRRHRGGQGRRSRSSMGRFSLTSPGWGGHASSRGDLTLPRRASLGEPVFPTSPSERASKAKATLWGCPRRGPPPRAS
jgi:hypothetical protein